MKFKNKILIVFSFVILISLGTRAIVSAKTDNQTGDPFDAIIEAAQFQICIEEFGGEPFKIGPREIVCNNIPSGVIPEGTCENGPFLYAILTYERIDNIDTINGKPVCGQYLENTRSMEKEARCKFFDVSSGYIGGTIEASGLGAPSFLRLNDNGKIYKLPVIESSIARDDVSGNWTAEFSTVNPETSQPLVPEGSYGVDCFGENGTANGAGMQVTILR